MASFTKADLVAQIASTAGLSKADAERALSATLDGIRGALEEGDKVTLVGFGSFDVMERKSRNGRDPRTKQEIRIPASRNVKFRPGKDLRDAVN